MSLKKEIINILELIADILEFKGENKFKVAAFRNGSNVLRRLEGDLEEMIADESIKSVKGVGKVIQSVIFDYYDNGGSADLMDMLSELPDGLIDLFNIRGIGAKKIKVLNEELGITNLGSLEQACLSDQVADLKGFGKKTQDKILDEILKAKSRSRYMLLHKALEKAEHFRIDLKTLSGVERVELTGELRRRREVISNIELLVAVNDQFLFESELSKLYYYNNLNSSSNFARYEIIAKNAKFTVYSTSPGLFERVLFETTGSAEFLNSLSIEDLPNSSVSEHGCFKKLGLPFVIPEMREQEFLNAPEELRNNSNLSIDSFNGFMHFHTTFSDGMNTLEEMVITGKELGYKYFAVCDHSKSAFYANGLSEDRIFLQKKEIADVSSKQSVPIFHGIESDILRDGSLDYDKDFMSNFDFVVASIHSIFSLSEDEMTNRIIKAIKNEYTDILAHPTGRLLLARDPFKVDIRKVIDACAENNVAIEINSSPHRLDLDWREIFYAREKGVKFAINPDAHSVEGIMDTRYGIMMARKGGVQKSEVINCFSEQEFIKFINRKTKRISRGKNGS